MITIAAAAVTLLAVAMAWVRMVAARAVIRQTENEARDRRGK